MISEVKLTELLRAAERAHAEHEKALGHPDPEWAPWYAHYITQRVAQEG